MKKRTFIKRFLYGLLLGLAITVVYIQNSSRCAHIIIHEFQNVFKKDFGGYFSGTLADVSLIPLSLTYKNVTALPVNESEKWKWKAEQLTIDVSVLSYFFTGKYELTALAQNAVVHSEMVNNQPSIKKHIERFFGMPKVPLPLVPQEISCKHIQAFIIDKEKQMKTALCIDMNIDWKKGYMHACGTCYDGYVTQTNNFLVKKIQGTCSGYTEKKVASCRHPFHVTASCMFPHLPKEQQCFVFQGNWDGYKGNFYADNQDNSLRIKKVAVVPYKKSFLFDVDATCNVQTVNTLMTQKELPLSGNIHITGTGTIHNFFGTVYGLSLGYDTHTCDMTELFFQKKDEDIQGAVTLYHNDQVGNGIFSFDTKEHTGFCTVKPTTEWNLFNQWNVKPYASGFTCSLTKEKSLDVQHTLVAQHKKTETEIHSEGMTILKDTGLCESSGMWGEKTYQAKVELFPSLKPHFVWCKNKKGKTVFRVTGHYPSYTSFDARLSYSLLRSLMREAFDYDIPGEGNVTCHGNFDNDTVSFTVATAESTVAVPEMYNFISDMYAHGIYNYKTADLEITDLFLGLHKGTFQSKGIKASWDKSFTPTYVYAPLNVKNCFLNVKKDFFVLVSGDIMLQKELEKDFLLHGNITLDKGQLKENPLSLQGQKEVTQFMMPSDLFKKIPLELSLNIGTKQPVYIETPFLQSRAVLKSYLHNTLSSPSLSGKLSLKSGLLHFPYKPLALLKADITFLPHEVYDPLVHIVACSTIKKYTVTLTVTGSLQTPHITLDAVPFLTEEQIVALLFTGTVEETLPGMVPVFVVHSLETLLFGTTEHSKIKDSLLKDSLKKIRFVPRLADKTGKGEIRGAIEIDINDRLHAMVQKNFSLKEDTRLELEYIISDDVSVKGIKDERGDIGGELEMRFKL